MVLKAAMASIIVMIISRIVVLIITTGSIIRVVIRVIYRFCGQLKLSSPKAAMRLF